MTITPEMVNTILKEGHCSEPHNIDAYKQVVKCVSKAAIHEGDTREAGIVTRTIEHAAVASGLDADGLGALTPEAKRMAANCAASGIVSGLLIAQNCLDRWGASMGAADEPEEGTRADRAERAERKRRRGFGRRR